MVIVIATTNAGDDGIKIRDPDPDETTHDAINNSITENRINRTGGDGIDSKGQRSNKI